MSTLWLFLHTMLKLFSLADDDSDDTQFFKDALRDIDPSLVLTSASNGRELLEQMKSTKTAPSIIFLDINMPEMNGWEALKALKADEDFSKIPVILYSTTSSFLDGKKAVSAGALCFYEKPPSFLKLRDFLRNVAMSDNASLRERLNELIESRAHKIFN